MIPLENVLNKKPTVLWVASAGGHFAQLERIAKAVDSSTDSLWVTFENAQTAHLRSSGQVLYVPYIPPRGYRQAMTAARQVWRHTRGTTFDFAISTGSALAGAVLPITASRRVKSYYVESVSRTEGPSMTGRALRLVPGVSTFTQHERWSSGAWPYAGSVLHSWDAEERQTIAGSKRKIFVTLGTIRPYRFDRAINAVLSMLKEDDSCIWQTGITHREDLPGEVHAELSRDEMLRIAGEADVVITHAGVGTIMQLLDQGVLPVLLVRDKEHLEHVDDHQRLISAELIELGLAVELDLDNPDPTVLDRAREMWVSVHA